MFRTSAVCLLLALVAACSSDRIPGSSSGGLDGGSSGIGSPCTGSGQDQGTCLTGEVCITDNEGFPGGYCTQQCDPTACPSGSTCIMLQSNVSACFASCQVDSDCRQPAYSCDTSLHVCVPTGQNEGEGVTPGTLDGGACVTPIQSPTDPGVTVLGMSTNVSAALPSRLSAETELAVDPTSQKIVVGYIQVPPTGGSLIGTTSSQNGGGTFRTPTTLPANMAVDMNGRQSDPVVTIDTAGHFYVAWIGFDVVANSKNPQDTRVFVARSDDGGITFPTVVQASPMSEGSGMEFLDKPWIAASPVDGSLYLTWTRNFTSMAPHIRLSRSTDQGQTWSAPIDVNEINAQTGDPTLAQVTVGPDNKAYVTWVELRGNNTQFGSTGNAVMLQVVDPMGNLVSPNVQVSQMPDSPTFEDPSVAVSGQNVYVGFVSGTPAGDWDVRVAASLNGGMTFQPSAKVNDDPTCATHFHQQIGVDVSGNVHAVWYDNRYLVGNVFHAASPPASATTPLHFGTNTFVNGQSFPFTTSRNTIGWLGDYLGLAIVQNQLFVSWTAPQGMSGSQVWFTHGMASP